jgi:hypothetical protein
MERENRRRTDDKGEEEKTGICDCLTHTPIPWSRRTEGEQEKKGEKEKTGTNDCLTHTMEQENRRGTRG